jgi:hypothetical protein
VQLACRQPQVTSRKPFEINRKKIMIQLRAACQPPVASRQQQLNYLRNISN